MNTNKKLYREFFGLRESKITVDTKNPAAIKAAQDMAKTDPNTELHFEEVGFELDEAELINHMGDYKGGVEYVLVDPAQAKATAADISQWAQKKGFTIVQQTISPSGKVGYFYFRLGENPYKESKRIQGYISQLPMIKHFRFNVKNQETPEQPRRREI